MPDGFDMTFHFLMQFVLAFLSLLRRQVAELCRSVRSAVRLPRLPEWNILSGTSQNVARPLPNGRLPDDMFCWRYAPARCCRPQSVHREDFSSGSNLF